MASQNEEHVVVREEDFENFQRNFNEERSTNENMKDDQPQSSKPDLMSAIMTLINQNTMLMNTMMQQQNLNRSTPQNYHVMPDLSKTIENFNGEDGPHQAQVWITKLETTATLHKWPEEFIFETARSHLIGAAKYWYEGRVESIRNWTEFSRSFKKTFLFIKSKTEKWNEMQKRVQLHRESINVYFHEKVSLCKQLNLDFDEIKEQVIIGLLSKELSQFLMSQNHVDEDELLGDIINYNRIVSARIEKAREKRPKFEFKEKTQNDVVTKPKVETESKPRMKSNEVKCYNCSEMGHFSYNCTKPKREIKCLRCNEVGHTPKYCKKPRNFEKPEIKILGSVSPCNKYIKKVKISNEEYMSMIDCGSSDCTIKATAAIKGKFRIMIQDCELKGFGNETQSIVKSCGIIVESVEIDGVKADNVSFRIVSDDVQPIDVIIGRNFTELSHIIYYKIDDKFNFAYKDHLQDIFINQEQNQTEEIKIAENTRFPQRSINFINAHMENEDYILPIMNKSDVEEKVGNEKEFEKIMNIETVEPVETRNNEEVTMDEIVVGSEVTHEQKTELWNILNRHREVIAKNIHEIGKTDLIEMDIEEKPESRPVMCKPYKTTQEEREKIREIVGEWKEAGIVTETNSPYASPVLLVKKKTGEHRLVVDYRRLNCQTERINFPIPNFDEISEVLVGAKLFVTLDLAHGYLQIPLAEKAQHKTAFITPDETGQFTRAMFGLMNAPFYFAKLMHSIFGPYQNKLVIFYLDDILIPADNWTELMDRLELVLKLLKGAKLTLKLPKCEFGKNEINYLGFVISSRGLQPGPRKLEAIFNYPRPCNNHEIKRFLGLVGFFRRFIPKFALIVEPLSRLLKKESRFHWDEEQEKSFTEVKSILMKEPVLQIFNPKARRTELHTDACKDGLASILLQSDETGKMKMVYAVSRKTTDAEKSYHSSKLELLAIIWSIERLRFLLLPIKFTVVTDCQALCYLNKNKTNNSQIIRWCNTLSEYDFEIRYKPGEIMQHVDALSRAPTEEPNGDVEDLINDKFSVYSIISREEEILLTQRTDDNLSRKIRILKMKPYERTKAENGEVESYILKNKILYKIAKKHDEENHLYVVPATMRKSILIKYHDLDGHGGLDRTLEKIQRYYYFPGMRKYVSNHLRMCLECILAKHKVGKQEGYLNPIPPGKRPFEVVHCDYLGPFVTSSKGNKYILVIIDNLTKYVQLEIAKNVNTTTTITRLGKFIDKFGAPIRLITDRGTCFTSKKFEEFCNNHGIRHTLNSSRHPQANGMVERVNNSLIPMLQMNVEDNEGRDWDQVVKKIEKQMNTSVNKTTNNTPFEALYGYLPRFNDGLMRTLTEENEHYRPPQEIQEEIQEKIRNEQNKTKGRYDKHRHAGIKYQVGDIVYMKANRASTGESTKLQRRFKGPLVITQVLPSDTYRVTNLEDKQDQMRTTAHVSQLKLWKNYDCDEDVCYDEEDVESEQEPRKKKEDPEENKKENRKEDPIVNQDEDQEPNDDVHRGREVRRRRPPKYLQDYSI